MLQSALEVLYLFKELLDEFLAIAFKRDCDDVLEVIYLVVSKLRLRKWRNCLFQLLQKTQERVGERVEPK